MSIDKKVYQNSLKINFYSFLKERKLKKIQAKIFEEIKNHVNLNKRNQELSKQYLDLIISNIIIGLKSHKNISIPKRKLFYSDPDNFEFEKISYRIFGRILKSLLELEYLGEAKGFTNYEQAYRSVYWGTAKFIELFKNADITEIHSRLAPQIILRSKRIRNLQFRDTPQIIELRSKLQKINLLYTQNSFSTILNDETEPVCFYPRISAIFNNRSFQCGGRLYSKPQKGISFQSLHKSERKRIKINGKGIIELDYSGLHLNMLYAQQHIQLSEPPYTFLGEQKKPIVKKAILILLNAQNEYQALHALNNNYPSENCLELLNAVKDYHHRISKYFCSGCWMGLQNKDAKMAVSILDYFMQKDISVLPIHDSFIIDSDYAAELKTIMEKTYSEYNNGFCCTVK